MSALGRAYSKWYKKLPYIMAFGTCFIKGGMSDAFTQRQLEGIPADNDQFLDYKRNARFATWSGAYCGCVQHWVYNVAYAYLFPGTSVMSRLICTAFDCTFHGPMVYIPCYYVSKSLMTGGTAKEGWNEFWDNKWETLRAYWKVWCPTVFVVMFFIPPEFRVLLIGAVSLFWLVVLSYIAPMVDQEEIEDLQKEFEGEMTVITDD